MLCLYKHKWFVGVAVKSCTFLTVITGIAWWWHRRCQNLRKFIIDSSGTLPKTMYFVSVDFCDCIQQQPTISNIPSSVTCLVFRPLCYIYLLLNVVSFIIPHFSVTGIHYTSHQFNMPTVKLSKFCWLRLFSVHFSCNQKLIIFSSVKCSWPAQRG